MTVEVQGQQCVPINLDVLSGRAKPNMSATGILAIVLLCIAIVVVLVYIIKLAVGKRRKRRVEEVTVNVDGQGASVSFMPAAEEAEEAEEQEAEPWRPAHREEAGSHELVSPQAVAVGAVTTSGVTVTEDAPQVTFDMWSADAPAGAHTDLFGDLVKPEHRLEADGGATMSVSRMMPASWGGEQASGAAVGAGRADSGLDAYFGSLMPPSAASLNPTEMSTFGSSLPSWDAMADTLKLQGAVDRNTVIRNNIGSKVGFSEFPFRQFSSFVTGGGLHAFGESVFRADLLAASSLGTKPSVSAEWA
jgi:hypothetical protein